MHLYEKQKISCCVFIKFLKCALNFAYFEKTEPRSFSIFQFIHSGRSHFYSDLRLGDSLLTT